jgi:hypothetical protein
MSHAHAPAAPRASTSLIQPPDTELVLHAEHALAQAHITLDLATIDQLLHPDYLIVQPGGTLETKAEVLASYQTGTRRWDSASTAALDVTIYGTMARVVGIWTAVGTNNGHPFAYHARFISIWINEQDRWRNVAYTSAEIPT